MGNRRVKKITIKGFRSFSDQVTLDLENGVVCIADPQGNGVKDLLDALSFVAGRPMHSSATGTELLFMGNRTGEDPTVVEVSVLVEETGDHHEVTTVSRALSQTGEDTYYLNGNPAEPEIAQDFLSGSGLYGYSLIDKNTSFDLLTSRYGNISSVIDRVSGADVLRRKAAQTDRLLSEKRKALEENGLLLKQSKEQKKRLLEESVRAKEYKKLNALLRKNEINILLRRIEQYEKDSKTALMRIGELNDRIAEKEKVRSEADLGITEKKIQQRNLENQETEARGIYLNGRNDIGDKKARMSVIDGRTETVNQNLDILNHDLVIIRSRLEKEKQNLKNLERQDQKIEDILLSVSRNRIQAEEEIRKKREELSRKTAEYEQTVRDRDAGKLELSSIEIERNGTEKLNESFGNRRKAIAEALSLKETHFPNGVSRESDLKRLSLLKEQKEKKELQIHALEQSLEDVKEKVSLFSSKQEEITKNLSAAQSQRDLLTDQEEEYDNYDTETIALLREETIPGVHDTAGELIRVRQGYEEVISAALGKHLQDVVCDDLASASEAASFLRQKNAGRLTFIPLKELEYKYRVIPSELLIARGYQGRALDYVEYDPQYNRVFQYLLGSTVIFQDFESAVNAGRYAGIQMVTLNHEVISDSEVVEGGSLRNSGTRILTRRNRIDVSASRVHDLEKEYQSVRGAYEQAIEEQAKIERQIMSTRSEIDTVRTEISEITMRTEMDDKALSDVHDEIKRLKEELDQHDSRREVTDLPGLIEELRNRFVQVEVNVKRLETLAESLYIKIDSLTVEIGSLEQQREEYNTRLSSLETERAVCRLSAEKAKDAIKAFESDIQDKLKSIETIRETMTALTREKERLEQEVRSMEVDLSDRVRVLSSFQEDRNSLRSQIDRMINDRDKAENEYLGFRLEKRALEVERDACLREAEEMKKTLYDIHRISYTEALNMKEPVFVLNEGVKESAHLRNLLQEYEVINTSAPEEYEIITQRCYSLERQRSLLEDEIDAMNEEAGQLCTRELTLWRQCFDDVSREFSDLFSELSDNSQAFMRTEGNSMEGGYSADIYIKREGYTARKLLLASQEDKSPALASFLVALHSISSPAVTIIDSIDDLLEKKDRHYLMESLSKPMNGNLVIVTDDEEMAKDAGITYAYLKSADGAGEFKWIQKEEFRVYTPDRDL